MFRLVSILSIRWGWLLATLVTWGTPTLAVGWVEPGQDGVAPDPQQLRAERIQVVAGDRLTLYTDLPLDDELRQLPQLLAAAIPPWCDYFGCSAPPSTWHLRGYLIQDVDRFRRAGLFPADLPPFPHGYQRGTEFWLYEQPSLYYRRHLLLHEATHGFAAAIGAESPDAWLREGIAERLGTHRWEGGQLTLGWFPAQREQVPYWGRIKMLHDEIGQQRGLTLAEATTLEDKAFRRAEAYAWVWAATLFLERHPVTAASFVTLRRHWGRLPQAIGAFRQAWADQQMALEDDWQLYVRELQYGVEFAPVPISKAPQTSPPMDVGPQAVVAIDARLGWQSTGIALRQGTRYALTASGRFQLARGPRPWWSEGDGVTIDYVQGRPLGQLLAAVAPADPGNRWPYLLQPQAIGAAATLQPSHDGVLYLRINDRSADLHDNVGTIQVTVRDAPPATRP